MINIVSPCTACIHDKVCMHKKDADLLIKKLTEDDDFINIKLPEPHRLVIKIECQQLNNI